METLIVKIAGVTYDVIGVISPGLIGILVWFGVFLHDFQSIQAHAGAFAAWTNTYGVATIFVIGASGYFTGLLLRWLSRGKIAKMAVAAVCMWPWKKETKKGNKKEWGQTLKFMTLQPSHAPFPGHSKELGDARREAEMMLKTRLNLPMKTMTWEPFYKIARALIAEEASRSLLPTYQNKYTFHRSLAVVFSVAFWETIGFGVYSACHGHWGSTLAHLVMMGGCAVFVHASSDQYQDNWQHFADAVIAETIVVCRNSDTHGV